jgi:hypothetical protein
MVEILQLRALFWFVGTTQAVAGTGLGFGTNPKQTQWHHSGPNGTTQAVAGTGLGFGTNPKQTQWHHSGPHGTTQAVAGTGLECNPLE